MVVCLRPGWRRVCTMCIDALNSALLHKAHFRSPDEATRNPGKVAPSAKLAPDWHPGYGSGSITHSHPISQSRLPLGGNLDLPFCRARRRLLVRM